ncbi:MAG: hypothetical protein M3Z50_03075 [Actinomycetota bacterium]|nr:hypothetical protein [Actinomycetota bacterium]
MTTRPADHPRLGLAGVRRSAAGHGCRPAPRRGTACSYDGRWTYRFHPEQLLIVRTTSIRIVKNGPRFAVVVRLDAVGSYQLSNLTNSLAGQSGRLGVFNAREVVLFAPAVRTPLDTGEIEISGFASRASAGKLFKLTGSG